MHDFLKAKGMTFSREVIAGHGVIKEIGNLCKSLGLKGNCLIVTGKKTRKIAGNTVKDFLKEDKYEVQIIEVENANMLAVEKVRTFSKEIKANFIVGVGGGSKIDIGKLSATQLKIPFISVPTSASHDGIASPRATIKNKNDSKSIFAIAPFGILADTSIIIKAPYRMLASGCADVISNSTAVKDWVLAHKLKNEEFSSSAATLAEMSANEIIENAESIKPNLEESAWILIRPIILSGASMCVANSSRPASGSEHLFSHALDMLGSNALHGEQCGLGTIMMMYLHGGDWQRIKNALRKINAPTTAKELGVSREKVIKALRVAHKIRPDRYTILGDRGLTEKAAEGLVEKTEVV